MKKTVFIFISLILTFCLLSACGGNENQPETTIAPSQTSAETTIPSPPEELTYLTTIGNGANAFVFKVIDSENKTTEYLIKSDKATVGEALTNLGMLEISDANGEIKHANGIYANNASTGLNWVLYINGEKQTESVNGIEIKNGTVYTFKLEK